MGSKSQDGAVCTICGGTSFAAGPLGRMGKNGQPPLCTTCQALERHRLVRVVYDRLPDALLTAKSALQFSDDIGAPRDRLGDVEVSLYGRENSLDMAAIDRPDDTYDWVIANHVLEHVEDDHAAMREMLRVVKPEGLVQITVPTPSTALETWELPEPDPDSFDHWRGYGSDLPLRLAPELKGAFGLSVIAEDPVCERWDAVYLFTRSADTMRTVGKALLKSGLPVLRCA